jgi:raffinose/stachyose/melibiose transport system permease protein
MAMVNKSRLVNGTGKYFSLILLSILLIIVIFPMIIVSLNAFKTEAEVNTNGPMSLPQSLNLDTVKYVWTTTNYPRLLMNSTIIAVSAALIAVGISLLNAFALGIGKFKRRTLARLVFMLAMTLPNEALVYPLYYFFKLIHLYDNPLSVILTAAALQASFGTYLLTSVFSAFDREVLEAAMIDGCNKFTLLVRIVAPLSMPTVAVLIVFFFIGEWNDFFLPLIMLISSKNYTVPVAMALARSERNVVITLQSAAALLGILPCIIFFIIFQRTLTKGVTAGAIK